MGEQKRIAIVDISLEDGTDLWEVRIDDRMVCAATETQCGIWVAGYRHAETEAAAEITQLRERIKELERTEVTEAILIKELDDICCRQTRDADPNARHYKAPVYWEVDLEEIPGIATALTAALKPPTQEREGM